MDLVLIICATVGAIVIPFLLWITIREKYLNEHPERKEDFEITINKDDELEIHFDNWCYHWVIDEYELH